MKQKIANHLDQIEINAISILQSLKSTNASNISHSQSMISEHSIFENNDEDKAAIVKEIKKSCNEIVENIEGIN